MTHLRKRTYSAASTKRGLNTKQDIATYLANAQHMTTQTQVRKSTVTTGSLIAIQDAVGIISLRHSPIYDRIFLEKPKRQLFVGLRAV